MIKIRKRKTFKFSREEFEKNQDNISQLPWQNHKGYDACWVYVEGDDKHNPFGFGTQIGVFAEVTFKDLVEHRQEVLDKLCELQEIEVVDENGTGLFIMNWCY